MVNVVKKADYLLKKYDLLVASQQKKNVQE